MDSIRFEISLYRFLTNKMSNLNIFLLPRNRFSFFFARKTERGLCSLNWSMEYYLNVECTKMHADKDGSSSMLQTRERMFVDFIAKDRASTVISLHKKA